MSEQFRLTVFTSPGSVSGMSARLPEWWQAVTGTPPEESTTNARLGTALVSGSFADNKLMVKIEADRIDWLMIPQEPEPNANMASAQERPSLGPAPEGLKAFSNVAEVWLKRADIPEVARMAFGAVLIHEEADKESGYRHLHEYLPIDLPEGASDFFFQINLPIPSQTQIPHLVINRLSQWSTTAFKLLRFRVAGMEIAPQDTGHTLHTLRIVLDINTSPEFSGPIPKDKVLGVYRELVDLGTNVLTDGVK